MTLDDAIDTILSGGAVGPADRAVVAAGAVGAERLFARLRDDRLGRDALLSDGPFNVHRLGRALRVLAAIDWPDLPRALQPFLESPRDNVRQLAARAIVSRGDAPAAGAAERLLRGPDAEAARGAIEGIIDALRERRAGKAFRARLLNVVGPQLSEGPDLRLYPALTAPADLVMMLDPERGAELLASPKVLRSDNPALSHVLLAIDRHGLNPPVAQLRDLVRGARAGCISPLVRCLARTDPSGVQPLLLRCLADHDRDIRAQAFESWLATRGVDLFSPTPAQRKNRTILALVALHQILGQMSGDGLAAPVEHVPPAEWDLAIGLVERAGATETAGLLRAALALVRETDEADDEELEAIEESLFDDEDRLHARLHAHLVPLRG